MLIANLSGNVSAYLATQCEKYTRCDKAGVCCKTIKGDVSHAASLLLTFSAPYLSFSTPSLSLALSLSVITLFIIHIIGSRAAIAPVISGLSRVTQLSVGTMRA